VELQDPASTEILLTAAYGEAAISSVVEPLYGRDTSLQPDGRTRVLGYRRQTGKGSVVYFALGHCHSPIARGVQGGAAEMASAAFHGVWEVPAFMGLMRNAIRLGVE